MGANSGVEKISLDNKIQFLQNTISKKCTYHQKTATLYCSVTNCSKCPYLCHECFKDNVHQHSQGIQERDQFIKTMVQLIQTYKMKNNKLIDDNQNSKDYAWVIKQQMKLMEHIQLLQNEVLTIIREYKNKLQEDLEKNIAKANRSTKTQTDLYFKFYANPNILVNKIMSDGNNEFILSLKRKLIPVKQLQDLTAQQEVAQHRNSLNLVKQNIKQILNINTTVFLRNKKVINQYTDILCNLKKPIPSLSANEYPLKLCNCGGSVTVSTNKDIWKIQSNSKLKQKIAAGTLTKIQSNGQTFIGLVNPTTIMISDGKRCDRMSFITKISAVNLLKSNNSTYAILGEEEGIFSVIDVRETKTIFHYRCGDKPLTFIQKCQKNSTILCSSSKGPLFIFKYQTNYDEFQFQYIGQLNNSIFPAGQIQLMKINEYDLYLFGPCRNLVIFDLMLNAQILRTQYTQKGFSFSDACFCKIGINQVLLTLSQNQNVIYAWIIDKVKKTVKVDPLSMKNNNESVILSMCSNKEQLWIARDQNKQMLIYTLST